MDALDIVFHYHELTKHHLDRYARSLGYLDWASQPDPFRRYRGAVPRALVLEEGAGGPAYDALYTAGAIAPLLASHVGS